MKVYMKKTMIIGVIALFISVSIAPINAETDIPSDDNYAIECAIINPDGSLSEQIFLLNSEEVSLLQIRLSNLFDLLKSTNDKSMLLNLLLNYLNGEDFPVISKIIEYLLR